MKKFMDENFLLNNEVAKKIFNDGAKDTPIFDWHCHLSPKEIYDNEQPKDIAYLWLSGDHYKWRAMRSFGINEEYITGNKSGYEKFKAWAKVLPSCIGNPLYHWAHLELQRYFGIYEPLSEETADQIWEQANKKIAEGGFTPRELIMNSNVTCLCTTDDAVDTLEYHKLLAEDKSFTCKVLPAFRPDKAFLIANDTFCDWVRALSNVSSIKIDSYKDFLDALLSRIEFFNEMGCRASDHSFAYIPYEVATDEEIENIFKKGINNETLSPLEIEQYQTAVLRFVAKQYSRLGWGMELHIGAMRNNNTMMFNKIGPDTGFDSIGDDKIAYKLSRMLDSLAVEGNLPKTILFTLNPKDNYVLGSMLGNFQSDETESKIQFGSAWWFNDNIDGMQTQMKALANLGVFGKFVGMVTDSRSFLSYPRHEYFRRILCGFIGDMVEDGLYPYDEKVLVNMVKDISYNNAKNYFSVNI